MNLREGAKVMPVVVLFLALGAAPPLAAALNRWRPAAGPYGANVLALAVARDGAVYAVTLERALFKSVDGGASWLEADLGLRGIEFYDVKASPADPELLYAATAAGIFKSADGGANWAPLPAGSPQASLLAIAPSAPSVLYAAGHKIFRSGDGGATWQEAHSGLPVSWFPHVLEVDPHDPNTVYTTWDHLYRTTDGGAHWLARSTSEPSPFWLLAIDPRHPSTLYAASDRDDLIKSTDGGVSWGSASAGMRLAGTSRSPFALAVDPSTSVVLAAVASADPTPLDAEIFRSKDGAASWRSVESGDVAMAFAFDPNGNRAYAGTATGMLASHDRGRHWTASNLGLRGTVVWQILPDPHVAGTLYLAVSADRFPHGLDLARSADGGASWAPGGRGLEESGPVNALAADPATAGALYAATERGLWKSADAGASWTRIFDQVGHATGVALDPAHPETVYTVGYSYFQEGPMYPLIPTFTAARSTDGGATWTSIVKGMVTGPPQQSPGQFNSVVIDPRQPRVVYVAGDRSFKSVDDGASWNELPLGSGVGEIVIDPRSSTTLYATNDHGTPVAKSLDGGMTWNPAASGLPGGGTVHQLAVDGSGTLYSGTDQGFYLSADGGGSWTALDRGLTDPKVLSVAVDPLRPGILYAGTAGHGLFVYTRH